MQPMANLALRAARKASQHIARAYDRPDLIKVSEKGHNDYVTNVDKEAERIIIESLREKYPDHIFTGEEGSFAANEASSTGEESTHSQEEAVKPEYEWVIDPIDGTANFVHGIPHFCISIACLHKGRLEHGVIVDPIRQDEFVASRGDGCRLNGHKMRVRATKDIDGAMLATSGGGSPETARAQGDILTHLLENEATIRQPGSAALDLAYVAAGKLDGLWMSNLQLWDMAAGALMVLEAGGLLGDFQGGANHLKSGNIIAAGPKLFKNLTPIVKQHLG